MTVLVLVVAAATASVLVVGVGERLRLPWPALVVVLGAAVALVPGVPAVDVDPELILPLFLPPLLYAAALRTSVALFRSRWRSILTLAVALTAATIAAVTATALVPGITVTAAVAVAAAVAPPDPVAVEAVAGPLRLPRRLLTVLQSEGLFNDAVTLVVFQAALAALAALATGDGLGWGVALRFVYALVAAVVIGIGLAWLSSLPSDRTQETSARAAITLVLPFAVYLAADAVAASGVVAVVAAGLAAVSYQDAEDTTGRLTSAALWGVVEVVITGLAFALVGAELRAVVTAAGAGLPRMTAHAGVVCAVLLDPAVLDDGDGEVRGRLEQVITLYEMLDEPDPSPERRQRIAEERRHRERHQRLEAAVLLAARAAVLAARGEPEVDPVAADRVLRDLDARGTSA